MRLRRVCPQCNTILHARRSVKDSSLYKTSRAIISQTLSRNLFEESVSMSEILMHFFETYIVFPLHPRFSDPVRRLLYINSQCMFSSSPTPPSNNS